MLIAAAAWIATSTAIILVNKFILVELGFPFPLIVTFLGMASSSLVTSVLVFLHKIELKSKFDARMMLITIIPVGLFQALTMFFGNSAYLFLSVSFIQMTKSLTPVFTMIALSCFGIEKPSVAIVFCVITIAIGTCIASYGEVKLSAIGAMCILVSEVTEALRLVLTQVLLVGNQCSPLEALFYLSPASGAWLILFASASEIPSIIKTQAYLRFQTHPYAFALSGCTGLLVSLLGLQIIKLSSSLTLKVLVAFRSVLLVSIGVYILRETVTAIEAMGYAISMVGFVWYNIEKHGKLPPDSSSGSSNA